MLFANLKVDTDYQTYLFQEQLGDALLKMLLIEILNRHNPRSNNILIVELSSNSYMNEKAVKMGIEPHEMDTRKNRYAAAIEARLAVIYLEEGIEAAREFVKDYINNNL